MPGSRSGESKRRGLWRRIWEEERWVRPFFSGVWLNREVPPGAELVARRRNIYRTISLYRLPGSTFGYYHLDPLEYRLPPGALRVLKDVLKRVVSAGEGVGDLREEIRREAEIELSGRTEDLGGVSPEVLSRVVAQYTAGYGIVEHFLRDSRVQDLYIDAPPGVGPIYLTIGGYEEYSLPSTCITNVFMTPWEAEKLLTKMKVVTGKTFSESHPILEANLEGLRSRLTVVGPPLSPEGLSFAFRRHSGEPWTLLRLIRAGAITPLAAGFLSFLVEGRVSLMVVGSRGAGKTSLLGALLFEIPRGQRIITIEDTPELPGEHLRSEGYRVLTLQVRSSTTALEGEMTADDALKVALRLGESVLVLGEVRGEEMKTLYEAMSAGVAGSAVLGTLHADSPEGAYRRVVYDRGIPPTSFTSTDAIVVSGLVRPLGTPIFLRRLTTIAEVVKERPGEFQELFSFNPSRDGAMPTKIYGKGSALVERIARDWGITYQEALRNIEARGEIRKIAVKAAMMEEMEHLLSAGWVARYNEWFNDIVREEGEGGSVDYERVVERWEGRFRKEALRR